MDSGGGRIYSMHETLCTVADMGVSGDRGAGRCMYVCARDGMHVWYVSTILASLTSFVAAMSAPFSKSREQMSLRPIAAALCNAVSPAYNNRETETERDRSCQGHTEEDGHGAGAGRVR